MSADMPLAGLHAEVVVNPDVVSAGPFRGVTTAGMNHWHLIEPAR
jgi:hypothetical protein